MDDVKIRIVEEVTPLLTAGLTRLMPQLIGRELAITHDSLMVVIAQPGVRLFVAEIGDHVVGTAQLTVYERPYGPMAWIDGVVVDSEQRGKGIAVTLMNAVMDACRELGLDRVSLTSNPQREAANHLYQKLGFEKYETNYYRYTFKAL